MSPKQKRELDRAYEAKIQGIRAGLAQPLTPPPVSRLATASDIAGVRRAEETQRYRQREEGLYHTERFVREHETEDEQRHLELDRARMLASQLAQMLARLDSVLRSESAEFSTQGTHNIMDIVPMIRQTEHELDAILDKYRLR